MNLFAPPFPAPVVGRLLALLALGASVVATPSWSADTVKESRPIGNVRTVKLIGSADLVLTQAETSSLSVEGEKDTIKYLKVEMRGDELLLSYEPKGQQRLVEFGTQGPALPAQHQIAGPDQHRRQRRHPVGFVHGSGRFRDRGRGQQRHQVRCAGRSQAAPADQRRRRRDAGRRGARAERSHRRIGRLSRRCAAEREHHDLDRRLRRRDGVGPRQPLGKDRR